MSLCLCAFVSFCLCVFACCVSCVCFCRGCGTLLKDTLPDERHASRGSPADGGRAAKAAGPLLLLITKVLPGAHAREPLRRSAHGHCAETGPVLESRDGWKCSIFSCFHSLKHKSGLQEEERRELVNLSRDVYLSCKVSNSKCRSVNIREDTQREPVRS